MLDLFSCPPVESPAQYDAPCRVRGGRRGWWGYYYATSVLAAVYELLCLLNSMHPLLLLLLLLLLLILYIDFLQLHSRHRQTYIFCRCFKQSEYSTADECIESHPTYMAGRLRKRVTDRVSRKSTFGLCRTYLLYIRDTRNILWTGI